MNKYIITYATETTPITKDIEADDPYSACMILGKASNTKKSKILNITLVPAPEVIWKSGG